MLTRSRPRLLAAAAGIALLAACAPGRGQGVPAHQAGPTPVIAATSSPAPPLQLPRGGRTLFPTYRLVAYYGANGGPGLGVLGRGTPDQAAAAIEKQATAYTPFGRRILPTMELITTVAQAAPGKDGTYSTPVDESVVQRYLDAARRHRMLLILDIQPGRSQFLPQVKRYERFLTQPDVGIALDPEWRMGPGQVPGRVIGSARAAEINAVSSYVAGLVDRYRLPEKPFVVHQFTATMLPDRAKIVPRPGLAVIFHADGFGTQQLKRGVFGSLRLPGAPFHVGFKLFYKADTNLMTPAEAMLIRPQPDLVTYQ